MMMDSDVQVWLDTVEGQRPNVVVPYVVSEQAREVHYQLQAVQQDHQGRAVIRQAGDLQLSANIPAALSRLSVRQSPGGHCEIEIVLTGLGMKVARYVFECPP